MIARIGLGICVIIAATALAKALYGVWLALPL